MMQRYIVFLNDRSVAINQDINIREKSPDETLVYFSDKSSITDAYQRFCQNSDCLKLTINAPENFAEACKIFNSLFTRIEAAGGIVRNQEQEYLFIKRWGVWDLPKGKLHKKEPAKDGAIREVSEETGLSGLTVTRQLPSTFHIYTDRNGKEILKETYWFEMRCPHQQVLVPQLEEDITEVKWFSAAELSLPVKNTYASLRHLLEKYLQE